MLKAFMLILLGIGALFVMLILVALTETLTSDDDLLHIGDDETDEW